MEGDGGRRRSPSPRRVSSPGPRRSRSRSPPRGRNYKTYTRSPQKRPTCTLFVGNIPYSFRERDLADYFERVGRLRNITLGWNRQTGQSRGHAFVEFEDIRDAEEAFQRYQGYNCEGRRLRLDYDEGIDRKRRLDDRGPRDDRPRSRSRSPPRRRSPVREERRPRGGPARSPPRSPPRDDRRGEPAAQPQQ